jgi:hypothetical protein
VIEDSVCFLTTAGSAKQGGDSGARALGLVLEESGDNPAETATLIVG